MKLGFELNKITCFFVLITYFVFGNSFYGQETKDADSLDIYLNEAYRFYDQSDYINSVKTSVKLLERAYEEENQDYIADAYYILGLNDESMLKYDKAEENYNKALQVSIKNRDSIFLVHIYNGLANIASLQHRYTEAENLYLKALNISDFSGKPDDKDIILNICWNYLDEGSKEKVEPYLKQLKYFLSEVKDNKDNYDNIILESDLNYILGRYYGDYQDYEKAHQYLTKAINLASTYNLFEEISQAYKSKAHYYKLQGNYEAALYNTEQHVKFYKNQLDENTLKKLQVERVKYEVKEYERALNASEKDKELVASVVSSKNKLNWLYLFICILLTVSLVIIYKENQSKKKLIKKLHYNNNELMKAKRLGEEAVEIKTTFISNISHELRTPLHGVVGITSLLLEEKNISKGNRELLKSLKFSGDYLLSLINNVLMMSKVNNNKIVVRPQTVYLKNLVQTIENSVDYSAQKNKVIKTFTIGENIPDKIVVDPNILSEILINLIENAIKFTKNGKVETTIELNENYSDEDSVLSIRFSVIDNGIGIPKNKRKEIFQKFSQLHSDKDMLTGTGIGLSLVTSLLDLLDTKIKLISKVGNGSIFYFDLLCKLPSKHNTKQISESNLINFQGKKILLVEDNEINKMVIKKFLSSCNIDLEIISDGLLAFEALSENDYDLVLLDINIPSMDGYKVAEGARSLGINVPIIAVTASEYTEIEDKVKQAGINDILIKPFQKKNLEDLLIKFLN